MPGLLAALPAALAALAGQAEMLALRLAPVLATGEPSVAPYLVGMGLGFLVGAFGHLSRTPGLVVLGIAILGLTIVLFVLGTDPSA
jgi:hypothetical protein